MDTAVTFNYSETDFIEYLNSSNSTTEGSSVEGTFKWTSEEIAKLIQIIIRSILIMAGAVGNCLTIYIMRRTSLKHLSTCFYMFLFAVADTCK